MHLGSILGVIGVLWSCIEASPLFAKRQECPSTAPQGNALHDTTPYASNIDQTAKLAIPPGQAGETFLVPATTELSNELGYNQTDDDWLYGEDLDAAGDPPEIYRRGTLESRMTQKRPLEASGFQKAYQAAYDYYISFVPGGDLVAVNKDTYGTLVQVDHLFELHQVADFLKSSFVGGNLGIPPATVDQWVTQATICGEVLEDLKNILNNPVNLLGVDGGLNNLKSRVIRDVTVTWADITFDRATAMSRYFIVIKPYYMEVARCVGNALAQKLTTPGLSQQCLNYAEATFNAAVKKLTDFLGGSEGGPSREMIEIDSQPLPRAYTSPAVNVNDVFNNLVNTCPADDLQGICNIS